MNVSLTVEVEHGGSTKAKPVAYWTMLAPNIKDYIGFVARIIAAR